MERTHERANRHSTELQQKHRTVQHYHLLFFTKIDIVPYICFFNFSFSNSTFCFFLKKMDLFSFATNIQQMALGGVQFVNKFRKKNLTSSSNYVIYYVIGENETNPNDINMFYLPFSNVEKMKLREFKEYFPFKGNVIFRFRLLLKDLVKLINEGYQSGLPLLKKKENNIDKEKGKRKDSLENELRIKKENKDGEEEEGGDKRSWETDKEKETEDLSEYIIVDEIEIKNITKQENGHYVWVDITNEDAHIPLCQGKIVAKVLFINRENYKSYDEIYFKDIYSPQKQVYNVNEKHLCSYHGDQQEMISTVDNKETENYNEKNIGKKKKEKKGSGSRSGSGSGDIYGDIYGDKYGDIYGDRYGDGYGDEFGEMKGDRKTTNETLFTEKGSTFFNTDNTGVSKNNKLNDSKKIKCKKDAMNSRSRSRSRSHSPSNSTIFKLQERSANTGFATNSVIHSNDTANNYFDIHQNVMRHNEMRNQEEIDETENRRKGKQKITSREEKKQEQMEEKHHRNKTQLFQNGYLSDERSVRINAMATRGESFLVSDEKTQDPKKKK